MGDSHDCVSGVADKGDQHGGFSHDHAHLPPTDGYNTSKMHHNPKVMNMI